MKTCLGIEVGHYHVKISYIEQGVLKNYISERIEVDLRSNMKLYAEFVRDILSEHGIRCRNVVFVLPEEETYVKHVRLPIMTEEQLKLNLPYEFQSYFDDELAAYQFDHFVIERTERELDILAAACKKEICQNYLRLAKLAKLKLKGLVPSVVGLERVLERIEDWNERDHVVAEFGRERIRLHFFRRGIYDVTHSIEPGDEGAEEAQLCEQTAVQIMRILKFYGFHYVDNNLEMLYYCGSRGQNERLIDRIQQITEFPVKHMGTLIWNEQGERIESPQTFGVLYSDKNRINLYPWELKRKMITIELLIFSAVMILILFFVRFAVIEPMRKADQAELVHYRMEKQLEDLREANRIMGEITEEYAHYGKSYQDMEEAVPDRILMLDTLKHTIFPNTDRVMSVSINEDQMDIVCILSEKTRVSDLIAQIEAEDAVRYVAVAKETKRELAGRKETEVAFTVWFKTAAESGEEA